MLSKLPSCRRRRWRRTSVSLPVLAAPCINSGVMRDSPAPSQFTSQHITHLTPPYQHTTSHAHKTKTRQNKTKSRSQIRKIRTDEGNLSSKPISCTKCGWWCELWLYVCISFQTFDPQTCGRNLCCSQKSLFHYLSYTPFIPFLSYHSGPLRRQSGPLKSPAWSGEAGRWWGG